MPALETLTTDAQLKAQALAGHITRLLEEREQFRNKGRALVKEEDVIRKALERIDVQLAEAGYTES